MEQSRRNSPKVEQPGRLQLAILEWQRQLLAKSVEGGEPWICERGQPTPGLAA